MSDPIEDAFKQLRMETLHQVRAPGAGEARRTVRRRRFVQTSLAAVASVALLAGGTAFVMRTTHDGNESPAGVQPSSSGAATESIWPSPSGAPTDSIVPEPSSSYSQFPR